MTDAIIREAARRIAEKFHPERIILFGSQAKGTADDKSDVDLLVICRVTGKRRAVATEIDRSLRGLRIARDIVVITPDEYERDKFIPGTIARPAFLEGKSV
jgi:uncharacterized protein